jgi:hypothetical protein
MNQEVHECQCPDCQQTQEYANWQLHHQMNVFLSRLNEQQRRWYVALESKKIGRGGDSMLSLITGMDVETIRRGRRELDEELASRPTEGARQEVGGRVPVKKRPTDREGAE